MCFPNRQNCESGKLLDLYLKNKDINMGNEAVHLLFAMNRWETRTQIIEKLQNGVSVVCDRYAYSGVAYSAAKGLDFDWCLGADRGLLRPDLVFFIDISPEAISQRSGFGDERFERVDFQAKVDQTFSKFKAEGCSDAEYQTQKKHWINIRADGKSIEHI